MSKFILELKQIFENKEHSKAFIFVFSIYFITYFSILRYGVDYLDDIERGFSGKRGWENFSRYTSNFLSSIFNMSDRLTDMSPLPQLLAIVFLSVSSLIIARTFLKKYTYIGLLASTIIAINPFFLESISFKFDSPYMSLALLSCVLPFAFLDKPKVAAIVTFVSSLILYTTYQAENSVFIMMFMFSVLKLIFDKHSIKFILIRMSHLIISFLLATLVFKLFIVHEINTYVSSEMLSIKMMLPGITANITNYLELIYSYFKHTVLGWVSLLALILIPIITYKKTNNLARTLVISLIVFLAFVGSYGLYTVLNKPLFEARALNGMGAFFCLLLLFLYGYSSKKMRYFINAMIIVFTYNLIVIAHTYGNALQAQKEYNDFRMEMMLGDLNYNLSTLEKLQLYIDNPGKKTAIKTKNAIKVFPVIDDLIRDRMQKGYWWSAFSNYKHKLDTKLVMSKCVDTESNQPVKIVDTPMHKIDIYKNNCVIVFYK